MFCRDIRIWISSSSVLQPLPSMCREVFFTNRAQVDHVWHKGWGTRRGFGKFGFCCGPVVVLPAVWQEATSLSCNSSPLSAEFWAQSYLGEGCSCHHIQSHCRWKHHCNTKKNNNFRALFPSCYLPQHMPISGSGSTSPQRSELWGALLLTVKERTLCMSPCQFCWMMREGCCWAGRKLWWRAGEVVTSTCRGKRYEKAGLTKANFGDISRPDDRSLHTCILH